MDGESWEAGGGAYGLDRLDSPNDAGSATAQAHGADRTPCLVDGTTFSESTNKPQYP